eukprot:GHVR01005699.1.p1 GENE.GHVR01005699.1~~GHVR01005699.1.p1  ORF type:complete len:130 (+),score=42.53 GHVR01005699.1:82-471(+)
MVKGLDAVAAATGGGIFLMDQTRTLQCLNNILSNAIKYTLKGGVSLSIYAKERWTNDAPLHDILNSSRKKIQLDKISARNINTNNNPTLEELNGWTIIKPIDLIFNVIDTGVCVCVCMCVCVYTYRFNI